MPSEDHNKTANALVTTADLYFHDKSNEEIEAKLDLDFGVQCQVVILSISSRTSHTSRAHKRLTELFDVMGKRQFYEIPNTPVRVELNGTEVMRIGHFLLDTWIDVMEPF